jgi:hypothetical protein
MHDATLMISQQLPTQQLRFYTEFDVP